MEDGLNSVPNHTAEDSNAPSTSTNEAEKRNGVIEESPTNVSSSLADITLLPAQVPRKIAKAPAPPKSSRELPRSAGEPQDTENSTPADTQTLPPTPRPRKPRRTLTSARYPVDSDEPDQQPKRPAKRRRGGQPVGRRKPRPSAPTEEASSVQQHLNSESPLAHTAAPPPSNRSIHDSVLDAPASKASRPVRGCRIAANKNSASSPPSSKPGSVGWTAQSKDGTSSGKKVPAAISPSGGAQSPQVTSNSQSKKLTDTARPSEPSSPKLERLPKAQAQVLLKKLECLESRNAFARIVEDYFVLVDRMYFAESMVGPTDQNQQPSEHENFLGNTRPQYDPYIYDKVIYDLVVDDNKDNKGRQPYFDVVDYAARKKELEEQEKGAIHPSISAYATPAGRQLLRESQEDTPGREEKRSTEAIASNGATNGVVPFRPVTRLEFLVSPIRKQQTLEKWAPIEVAKFQSSICSYGKRFHEISQIVGTKTPHECIDFYYEVWKVTSRYRSWKNHRNRSEFIRDYSSL
eukprot:Selendium_serpulae@DN5501_c0_g1_i1.p1